MSPSACMWFLLALTFGEVVMELVVPISADLVIDVGTTGCQTDMPISLGVAQTFKVLSLYTLDQVDIWIMPDHQSSTLYDLEIWDNTTLTPLGYASYSLNIAADAPSSWYSFPFNRQVILRPNYTYKLMLLPLSNISGGGFSYCSDVYADGSLYLQTSDPFPLNDMSFRVSGTPLQMAHWTLNGNFDDMSPAGLAPAVPVGSNVELLGDYASIRVPGHLNFPRVNIHNISFAVAFNLRVPSTGTTGKRFLYSDWSQGQWQFLSEIDDANNLSVHLRRNIATNGANIHQELVDVISSIPVPLGEWFDVAWTFDRTRRTLTLYFNQQNVGSAAVRPSVNDVTLKDSNTSYYQFGRKNDEATNLDADLRHLRVYATQDVTLTSL